MRISRRQLSGLIRKVLNEVRIKPGGDLDLSDEEYGNIQTLARHDEPEFRAQGDELAGAFGHEGSFSQDMSDYDRLGVKRAILPYNMSKEEEAFVMNNPKLWSGDLVRLGNEVVGKQRASAEQAVSDGKITPAHAERLFDASPTAIALNIFHYHFDYETFPGGFAVTLWPNGAAGIKDSPEDPEVPADDIAPIFKYMVDTIRDNVEGVTK